jgi:CheY-like chemotaxis protein
VTTRPDALSRPARILIVDDERQNRTLLEVMLEPEGYVLETAENGDKALAMVGTFAPDLVLLDIMMPGMNGYVVTSRIRENPATKHIPIILLSALDDRSSKAHGLGAGADAFLGKPIDRSELCAQVKQLLNAVAR